MMKYEKQIRKAMAAIILWLAVIILGLWLRSLGIVTVAYTEREPCLSGMHHWESHIERWEGEYGIPYRIIRSLMLAESGGQQCIKGDTGLRDANGDILYAVGLFQVVDGWGRVEKFGDLTVPDNNARAGLEYFTNCNRAATGGESDWSNTDTIRDALWCYHDGLSNYKRGYKSAAAHRHGRNVLRAAGLE